MIDLSPAADRMKAVLAGVPDEALILPTPCPDTTVGDMADHVGALTLAFTAVASKQGADPPPPPSADNLEPRWRERIGGDLDRLVDAWRDPESWQGTTNAGGNEMPGELAGLAVLDELTVHGWDIAVATRQPYEPRSEEIDAATGFVTSFDAPRDGTLFGPVVEVGEDASPLHRLLGLTGRDPGWTP